MNEDLNHLRLLSVFYYVLGGLTAFVSCIPFLHLGIGIAMATGLIDDNDPALPIVGSFIMVISCFVILLGWTFAACLIATGRFLSQQRRYMFCLVVAAIACLNIPFGTILGVFTIVVLMRESVQRMFEAADDAPRVTG